MFWIQFADLTDCIPEGLIWEVLDFTEYETKEEAYAKIRQLEEEDKKYYNSRYVYQLKRKEVI